MPANPRKEIMLIKVYGSSTKRMKALVRDAVKHVAANFFDKRILENLEISVKFDSKLMDETGDVAQMEWMDNHLRGRVFTIFVDKNINPFLTILCVMHEMVHVKQYAKGELFQSLKECNLHKWNRKEWVNDEKVPYWDLPWEIEAHGREKGLMLDWMSVTDLLSEDEKQDWRAKFMFS
jgi:hypothetical protein